MKSKLAKKLIAAAVAVVLPLSSMPDMHAYAEETVEETVDEAIEELAAVTETTDSEIELMAEPAYKSTILRDSNGNVYDLGGMEISVAQWWEEDLYDSYEDRAEYLDWVQETYNFTIKHVTIGDWSSNSQNFANYVATGGDENNYLWTLWCSATDATSIQNGLMYDLSSLNCLDFTKSKYQANKQHEKIKGNGKIYGMNVGESFPTDGMYFDKEILAKAGISADTIYDMQANGTWTWEAWVAMMDKVQAIDEDKDGNPDYAGVAGNTYTLVQDIVASNNGEFIGDNGTNYTVEVDSDNTKEALIFAQNIVDNYMLPQGEQNWDYYKQAFLDGQIAFLPDYSYLMENVYLDESYGGNYVFDKRDKVGFVMFPKGPQADSYARSENDNFMVIPACYDAERAWKIAFAWDVYTDYKYYTADSILKNFDKTFDTRAYTETLPMMFGNVHVSRHAVIPGLELGEDLLWNIHPGSNIEALIDEAKEKWQRLLDEVAAGSNQVIKQQPSNCRGTLGSRVAIGIMTKAGCTYRWQYRNSGSSEWCNSKEEGYNTSNIHFQIDDASKYDGRQYRCIVTDENGEEYISNIATVRVKGDAVYEILKDENGNIYDLGGMEIIVRDWWTMGDGDSEPQNENEEARAEYLEWIQETYNFTIKQVAVSDWGSTPQDFIDYIAYPDDNNYVFALRSNSSLVDAMYNGYMYDLSTLDCLNFNESKFQGNQTHKLYSHNNAIYAMSAEDAEPRTGVYFNKTLLREAGIDPDSIYEMQQNGTWTWSAWTKLMDKVQRDVDGDGEIDIYGMAQNDSILTQAAIFSNNGSLFGKKDGQLTYNLESEETVEALHFAEDVFSKYSKGRENWDDYKRYFANGEVVFMAEDAYVAYGTSFLSDSEYEYGFVMFPKGPRATDYVNVFSGNFYCIPAVYDAERAWKIAFAWNLYTNPTPGYEISDDWKNSYYNSNIVDSLAIEETLSMMRTKGTVNYTDNIAGIEIGSDLLWNIKGGCDVEGVINNIRDKWMRCVNAANGINVGNLTLCLNFQYDWEPIDNMHVVYYIGEQAPDMMNQAANYTSNGCYTINFDLSELFGGKKLYIFWVSPNEDTLLGYVNGGAVQNYLYCLTESQIREMAKSYETADDGNTYFEVQQFRSIGGVVTVDGNTVNLNYYGKTKAVNWKIAFVEVGSNNDLYPGYCYDAGGLAFRPDANGMGIFKTENGKEYKYYFEDSAGTQRYISKDENGNFHIDFAGVMRDKFNDAPNYYLIAAYPVDANGDILNNCGTNVRCNLEDPKEQACFTFIYEHEALDDVTFRYRLGSLEQLESKEYDGWESAVYIGDGNYVISFDEKFYDKGLCLQYQWNTRNGELVGFVHGNVTNEYSEIIQSKAQLDDLFGDGNNDTCYDYSVRYSSFLVVSSSDTEGVTFEYCESQTVAKWIVEIYNSYDNNELYPHEIDVLDHYSKAVNGKGTFKNNSLTYNYYCVDNATHPELFMKYRYGYKINAKQLILDNFDNPSGNYVVGLFAIGTDGNVIAPGVNFVEIKEAEVPKKAAFKLAGFSGTIENNFVMKYYMEFSNAVLTANDLYMEFVVNGKSQIAKCNEIAAIDRKNYCIFNCVIGVCELSEQIDAKVHYAGETYELGTFTYMDYLNTILNNTDNSESYMNAAPIVRALMNYASYAQQYFDYNADQLINSDFSAEQNTVESLASESVKAAIRGEVTGNLGCDSIRFYAASLVCKTDTVLKLYFKSNREMTAEEMENTYYGIVKNYQKGVEVSYMDNFMIIRLSDISIAQLGEQLTFNVYGGESVLTVKYSPMFYIKKAMDTKNTKLINLCKALYMFYQSVAE